MALPLIIKTVLSNIKTIGIAIVIGGAITFGAGLYFHGKKVQELESKIVLLESQTETEQIVKDIVDESAKKRLDRRREINEAISEANEELLDVQNNDEESRDYLSRDIPERVRLARERARCVSLPYTCTSDGREQD